MKTDWKLWGHLADRYSTPRPRRMLALDGGGIRGVLTLEVLMRIEKLIQDNWGPQTRLCDFFDYIAGTSTGAILAAGFARGMSVTAMRDFYAEFGKAVFQKRSLFERWKSLYEKDGLQEKLQEVFGPRTTLHPQDLQCLMLVVTRNHSTDSAWLLSTNPSAKYNAPDRPDCNLQVPLWQIVRASTAAPIYFPPEAVSWDPRDTRKTFRFVDGGTTAYNNPAFVMYRMATEPMYRLEWPRGEKNLLVVSIGTGCAPHIGAPGDDPDHNVAADALNTLLALMNQAAFDQDLACRTIGRCTYGRPLDREVGDLVIRDDFGAVLPLSKDQGRAFTYIRYDVELSNAGLKEIGARPDINPEKIAKLDSTEHMDDLRHVGQRLAAQVDPAHFGSFLGKP